MDVYHQMLKRAPTQRAAAEKTFWKGTRWYHAKASYGEYADKLAF